jgi:anti-sigma regulatory factor (Ser/Thr protein kinase)
MCWGVSRTYAAHERVAALGRRFCDDQLRAALVSTPRRDELLSDAMLVVSELLTNSMRAGSHVIRLSLALHRDVLRVVVDDDGAGQPRIRAAEDVETSGRGMLIVASLARAWAVETLIPGKQVWAELAVPEELTVDLPSCHRPVRFDPSVPANVPLA